MNKYEAIADIKQRQIKFLNDTAAHYRLGNRCMDDTTCLYHPFDDSTEGCAIGRHLDKELAKRMDNKEFGDSSIHDNFSLFNELPSWMKEMRILFLSQVQALHDNSDYWTDEGISEFGLAHVNEIKAQFNLD